MAKQEHHLQPRVTPTAFVQPLDAADPGTSWRLEIPMGPRRSYRLAQLDDYQGLSRRDLLWKPPLNIHLRARLSATNLPGTWGFGLWNDPFSFSFGLGGMSRRFPALPNAAWFFYASPPNYLSFRDDLPAHGFLAATFASPKPPTWLLALGSLGLPLALIPPVGRLIRRSVRPVVRQAAARLMLDPVEWHEYGLTWRDSEMVFTINGEQAYATPLVPAAPLGMVLWIDNQYAAWTPDGRLRYGYLANSQPAWLEIADFSLNRA